MSGEIRVWKSSFEGERPDAINWAFRKYFKTGKFPPKPADIAELIRIERESPYFEGWNSDLASAKKSSEIYREKAQESRQEFFKSPEYQAFLERMKKEHGI
jgi:hypothetical protein